MNAARPPAIASAAGSAVSYPGATSPYTRPSDASAISPPPATAPVVTVRACASMASRSSIVR